MASCAGYSGTPLAKKLGLKAGQTVAFVGLPESLSRLAEAEDFAVVERLPGWSVPPAAAGRYDLIHAFTRSAAELAAGLPALRAALRQDGMLWVSWPKRAAKVATDVTEDMVRDVALRSALVDVKVCAVDEVWSGLKLVIPKDRRRVNGQN